MIFELLAVYVIKDTLEGINKRLEEDQKRKARGLQREKNTRPRTPRMNDKYSAEIPSLSMSVPPTRADNASANMATPLSKLLTRPSNFSGVNF